MAVRDLVARREPLIAFALRSHLPRYDLDTAEGRVAALRADRAAGREDQGPGAAARVRPQARRRPGHGGRGGAAGGRCRRRRGAPAPAGRAAGQRIAPDANDPRSLVEREALKLALQEPVLAGPMFDAVDDERVRPPGARRGPAGHRRGRRGQRGRPAGRAGSRRSATPPPIWPPRPWSASWRSSRCASTARLDPQYVLVQLSRLQLFALNRRIADVKSRLQRVNPVDGGRRVPPALRRTAVAGAARPRPARTDIGRTLRCSACKRQRKLPRRCGPSWTATSGSSPGPRWTAGDGAVVVTTRGLWLPGRDRLGWHEIHKATWAGPRLTVIAVAARSARATGTR